MHALNFLSIVLLFCSVPVAIYVGTVTYFHTSGGMARKASAVLCYFMGVTSFAMVSGLVLFFRDGFHPDGVGSKGVAGVIGSLPHLAIALLIGGIFISIGRVIQRSRNPAMKS